MMGVIKRINLNRTEKSLNTIVEISTKISFLQSEVEHIMNQLDDNQWFWEDGILSKRAFEANRKNFEKKKKEAMKEINEEIQILTKLADALKQDLKLNKL